MGNILVFGDSIAYGAWDEEGGWVQRLRKFLYKHKTKENYYLLYNLSISGDTTEEFLDRTDFEMDQRIDKSEKTLVIFSIGLNDSRHVNGKPAVNPEKFKNNIIELVKIAKKHTSNIIFMGLETIYPSFVQWTETETYRIEDVQKYNDIIKSVCEEKNILFIEIFEKLMKLNYQDLLEDELHLNSEGHEKIFQIVKDFLIEKKMVKL